MIIVIKGEMGNILTNFDENQKRKENEIKMRKNLT